MQINPQKLKNTLAQLPEVAAAYLFGSVTETPEIANDLDLLVLLQPSVNFLQINLMLIEKISEDLELKPDLIDLLEFNLDFADPEVLYRAVSTGILLKNESPELLSDKIEALSRYFMENEFLIQEEKRLLNEMREAFCAD
jgi:predicted nucleotidyltransferase